MMEKQQTAVEWLMEKVKLYNRSVYSLMKSDLHFKHAEKMHREQIEAAYNTGEDSGCSSTQGTGQLFIDGKDYYTQTYGQ